MDSLRYLKISEKFVDIPFVFFKFLKLFHLSTPDIIFRALKLNIQKKILPDQKMSSQLWPPLGPNSKLGFGGVSTLRYKYV